MMTMGEMAKALQVYIKTFKIFGAGITYCTVDGIVRGNMVIPADQFCMDPFAERLEFFECQGVSVVNILDGTGCKIKSFNPESGRDMLKKLRIMLPPKTAIVDTKVDEILELLRRLIVKVEK
jgi:hypothetical protein